MATIEEYAATVKDEDRKANTRKQIFKVLSLASKKINFKDNYVARKNGHNYLSWAIVYTTLVNIFDDVEYGLEEREDGSPIREVGNGAMVKVYLIINKVKYTYHYPVVTSSHKALPLRPFTGGAVASAESYLSAKQVEFAQQRGFAKAAALAGLALELYNKDGLDFEDDEPVKITSSVLKAESLIPTEDALLASFAEINNSSNPLFSKEYLLKFRKDFLLLEKTAGIKQASKWIDEFKAFLSIKENAENEARLEVFTGFIERLKSKQGV